MNPLPYCEVYIVRHGETEWNVNRRLQGEMDIPLNENGIEQAKQLRQQLSDIKFSAVHSSDLSRAHETAAILVESKEIPIFKTSQLREKKLGHWEGKFIDELKIWISEQDISNKDFQKDDYFNHKWHDGIESAAEVYKRTIDYIMTLSTTHKGKTVLVATHGGVLSAIMHHLEFDPAQRWKVSNCSWMKLHVFGNGDFKLIEKDGIYSTPEITIF